MLKRDMLMSSERTEESRAGPTAGEAASVRWSRPHLRSVRSAGIGAR